MTEIFPLLNILDTKQISLWSSQFRSEGQETINNWVNLRHWKSTSYEIAQSKEIKVASGRNKMADAISDNIFVMM